MVKPLARSGRRPLATSLFWCLYTLSMPVVNMVQLVITSLLIVAVFAKDEINVEDGDCTLVGRNAKVDTQVCFGFEKRLHNQ